MSEIPPTYPSSPFVAWQGISGRDATSLQSECFSATVAVVSSYLRNNSYPVAQLPGLIREVYNTLSELHSDLVGAATGSGGSEAWQGANSAGGALSPVIPIDQSIEDDHIVCLEDGKRVRLLKRYIGSVYGMTPEQYRRKWGLPEDYPMVAPSLSRRRSEVAASIKPYLGRQKKG